ncbi:MAG: AraC family transcriptional regulator [Burkholderiales bacterium]|nr:AraC family transcriptional regulator [Burkholderiales bacterium]
MAHHTVSIHHVEQILNGAARRGLAAAALLQRAGISEALLEAPLARVSQAQYAALLRVARHRLRDEFWGLLQRPVPLGSFAQCCRLLVQTPTLGDAMRTGFRFFHGQLDEFVPRLRVEHELASISIVPRAADGPPGEYAQRAFLFLSFGLASWLAARRIPLERVEYRGQAPAHAGDVDRLFQAKVAYGREQYRLWFHARWLQLPQVQNAQSLREFFRQVPANLVVKYRDRTSVTDRIRRMLRSRLHDELPSLEEVARTLALTPQTLGRRLREEGQGFQTLKDDLRRDTAIELLQRPDLTLVDIAVQIGFSEASTFHRAFKKWTGVAPGEYRHRAH